LTEIILYCKKSILPIVLITGATMAAELKFLIFWSVIIIPFMAGAFISPGLLNPQRTARRFININIFFLEPVILLWTIWGLKLSSQLLILPAAGLATVLTGLLLGRVFTLPLKLHGASRASYIISSSLNNQGMTMGGLLCYMIAGEEGLALASIYVIYYLPFVFTVIFPYARISAGFKSGKNYKTGLLSTGRFFRFLFTPQNLPLAGTLVAVILQTCGVTRPDAAFPLDSLLICAISLYYFTLGINFKIGDLTSYFRELTAISLTKFLIIPGLTFLVLLCVKADRNIETIILLQSFAPAAIYSVISSILFELDSRLTSGIFVMNSLLFIFIVMPLLIIFNRVLIN